MGLIAEKTAHGKMKRTDRQFIPAISPFMIILLNASISI